MKRFFQFGCVVAALMTALGVAHAAPAQRYFVAPQRQARQAQRQQKQAQKLQNKPAVRSMMGLPPKWVDKLRDMSPEEQQRFMRNNARFQSLPPQRQEQIRRTLQRWNQMTPEQRDAMRNREQILERMSNT